MPGYAIYRLPHETHATLVLQTEGEPAELLSCTELNGKRGFVVAPFEVRPDQPILLIRPDRVERIPIAELPTCQLPVPDTVTHPEQTFSSVEGEKSAMYYSIDFANFHSQLEQGTFRKIVLARCADERTADTLSPLELFCKACSLYPRMFISLVNTDKSGCWLQATPEILLEGRGDGTWCTIALAGTMKLEGEALSFDSPPLQGGAGVVDISWSTKNIQEQRYVATYIAECLEQFTDDFHEEGPSTVRAADRDAFRFIIRNEHTPRRYYSGFMGMLDPEGETHLYVSLRCMNIEGDSCHLYAGGGLLKDSVLEQEWRETEAKLETMRRCIATRKM